MTVTFFGHRDFIASEELRKRLMSILDEAIGDRSVEFFLGGYGGFDSFAYTCCRDFTEKHQNTSLVFVTPYITESYQKNHLEYMAGGFDSIIYPELEKIPKRYAISHRNRYMAEKADLIICYVKRNFGGAYQAVRYAKSKGKEIINLAV